jgi:adenylosuccinate lyase
MPREDAYAVVQRNASQAWNGEGDFRSLLAADAEVARLVSGAELTTLFDPDFYVRHVGTIFDRVFGRQSAQ